jgi:hypothetical protein
MESESSTFGVCGVVPEVELQDSSLTSARQFPPKQAAAPKDDHDDGKE